MGSGIAGKIVLWSLAVLLLFSGVVQATTTTYVYTDAQGTPLAEADTSGNVTATFDYRPYGSIALGNAPNGPGYTGHIDDPDTALTYMQARYYDPSAGRFISADPVSPAHDDGLGQFNRYAYAYDNPLKFTDPDGRCPICIGVALYLVYDYANAPGPEDTPVVMSAEEKASAALTALPPVEAISVIRTGITVGRQVVNAEEKLSQRAASREAKRQVGIPTSQQAESQTNGAARNGTKVGRQQTFTVPKAGGGTENKSVQVSRDIRGNHAGMTQIEAGSVKASGQLDEAGRPRLQNEDKVRVDFQP